MAALRLALYSVVSFNLDFARTLVACLGAPSALVDKATLPMDAFKASPGAVVVVPF